MKSAWCEGCVRQIEAALVPAEGWRITVMWDGEGTHERWAPGGWGWEPQIRVAWPGAGLGAIDVDLTQEENGERNGFVTLQDDQGIRFVDLVGEVDAWAGQVAAIARGRRG